MRLWVHDSCRFRVVEGGLADERIRTADPLFTKQLLCQLSYVGVRPDYMKPAQRGLARSLGGSYRRVCWLHRIDRDRVDRHVVAEKGGDERLPRRVPPGDEVVLAGRDSSDDRKVA